MPTTIAQKLKIREGYVLRTIHAPAGFEAALAPLPDGVSVSARAARCSQVHWFVRNRAQLEAELNDVLPLVKGDVVCWIYYPKGSSKVQTDLTRDKGWDLLLAQPGMHWISLISFDDTWSAFGMRAATESDRKVAEKKEPRVIFDYIDTATKTIRLPEDLGAALKKSPGEKTFFEALSFSNRKEYVEWIVSAKRDDTRARRVEEAIGRLAKGWKNPANR